jgi:hypothetical protein
MSARSLRQRLVVLSVAGAIVAVVTILAVPSAVGMFTAKTPEASLRAAVAVRDETATWIRTWVAPSAYVACDPVMCAVLHDYGLPVVRLVPINLSAPDPVPSDVVVATAVIRNQFGARLAGVYAPERLASFGAGKARIVVRLTSQARSVAEYRRELHANLHARVLAGRELLGNRHISEPAKAASQLARGHVDFRILATLALLAHKMRVAILRFAGRGPRASQGMPLLCVDMTAGEFPGGNSAVSAGYARVETPASLERILAILRAQIPPLQPASFEELTSGAGMSFVRISYGAPSPMSLSGMTAQGNP